MKLKVVACGVFEPELTHLAGEATGQLHLHFLDAGLHATPDLLRRQVQQEIDQAVGHGYGAIVVVYGLCGRGTSGLLARDTPVVLPRVHDCMTLFLGSRQEYRRQFARHPGTFYTTPGWYEKKAIADRIAGGPREPENVRQDPRFADLAARYGEHNAADIIRFYDSWKRNYTRAAFIDTGVGNAERYEQYAQDMATEFGWLYERLRGDTSLLRDLLDGRWDDERVLVLQPGQRSHITGDDRIFAAIDAASVTRPKDLSVASSSPGAQAAAPAAGGAAAQARLGVGIDAGGTYTDCVLFDLVAGEVLAKSKALTTHHDLIIGIDEALDALAIPDPTRVELVALSTTLATNSIVEGKGGTPGAIIMSPDPASMAQITWRPLRVVTGEMGISGYELTPPDPVEIAQAVDELLALGVDAFAVSGYASVRNPEHELVVKQVIESRCDLPVICGHELSTQLNYVSRANTAILNARLLPVVRRLMEAVDRSLRGRRIHATFMVVKGDGSLVNQRTALERPIETILSGPAASVSGARYLTGLREAIIVDMGGTTTDTALIEEGLVRISPQGAVVGGWQTSVEAADISTVGLGGDSYLSFTPDRRMVIGPRRVVPLAYLCHRYPSARQVLLALDAATIADRSTPAALDFFLLGRTDVAVALDDREQAIVEALRPGPLSRGGLATRLGLPSPQLLRPRRLEELGIVQRSALTPTDLLHVTGEFRAWDAVAAEHALGVFAALLGVSSEEVIARYRQGVVERLACEIIGREWPGACDHSAGELPAPLRTALRPTAGDRLRAKLSYSRPIVAIGAPVEPFFPAVAAALGAELVIPKHAEVANAIGAIASEVVVRERAVVRPGEIANFVVYARSGRTEHAELEEAVAQARRAAAALAQERARRSGTAARDVSYRVDERRAFSSEGEEMLIEVLVEATVSGRPTVEAAE